MRKVRDFLIVSVSTLFLFVFVHCSGNDLPVTPQKSLAKISLLLTYLGDENDSKKLELDFKYLRILVQDDAFFNTIYNYKQKNYEMERFLIQNISDTTNEKAEATVEIRFKLKNSQNGFSSTISPMIYHFIMSKVQDTDHTIDSKSDYYWCIVKSSESGK